MSNVTVIPIGHCKATDTPNTNWFFCPNIGAAYFYAILYALVLVAHIAQGIIYRKGYSWVIAMGALWELLCYIFRIISINQVTNDAWYSAWFVLILVSSPSSCTMTLVNKKIACTSMDQRIRIHGLGKNGV